MSFKIEDLFSVAGKVAIVTGDSSTPTRVNLRVSKVTRGFMQGVSLQE